MKNILSQFNIYTFVILAIFPIITYSQNTSEIKIGTQIWTTKNLDVSNFSNGDPIPEANSSEEWVKASEYEKPAFCYYNFDIENGKVYGKLYNWYAVNDPRGLAPKGYHIPSDEEWDLLTKNLTIEMDAGEKIKSVTRWKKNGKISGNGNNSSGFNGLPGGYCNSSGTFYSISEYCGWWSHSENSTRDFVWDRNLKYDNPDTGRNRISKDYGLSVRCIKD